jgi:hypothetical protein
MGVGVGVWEERYRGYRGAGSCVYVCSVCRCRSCRAQLSTLYTVAHSTLPHSLIPSFPHSRIPTFAHSPSNSHIPTFTFPHSLSIGAPGVHAGRAERSARWSYGATHVPRADTQVAHTYTHTHTHTHTHKHTNTHTHIHTYT